MAYQAVRNRHTSEIKKINDQLEKLEESLAGTDECVVDMCGLEERLEDKLVYLEEDLASVKVENIELKNHLNSVIKELNAVVVLLNEKYGDLIETAYELRGC